MRKRFMTMMLGIIMALAVLPVLQLTADAANACTVTFDTVGGSSVDIQTVDAGEKAVCPTPDPTMDTGMEFAGWYTDDTYETAFDFDAAISGDTTVYAKWILPQDPDFSKLLVYGASSSGTSAEYGYSYEWTADPDNDNYSFVLKLDDAGSSGKGIGDVILPGNNGYDTLDITIKLEQITQDQPASGGGLLGGDTAVKRIEASIGTLDMGYLEGGSYPQNFYSSITVSGSGELTVQEWMAGGGGNDHVIRIEADTELTINSESGLIFGASGHNNSSLYVDGTLTVNGSIGCGAVDIGATGSVTANRLMLAGRGANDEDLLKNTLVIRKDGENRGRLTVNSTEQCTRWDEESQDYVPIEGAYYSALYIVANKDDGEFVLSDIIVLPDKYLSNGYHLEAVYYPSQDEYTYYVTIDDGDENEPQPDYTLPYAANTLSLPMAPEDYTVSYDLNFGEGTTPSDQTQNVGTAFTAADDSGFSRKGYTFRGWAADADATEKEYGAGDSVSAIRASTKLYAVWMRTEYTISYELGAGTVNGTNPTTYNVDSSDIVLINPVCKGYVFTGWTGTGLNAPALTVTIEKGSTGVRSYTATW